MLIHTTTADVDFIGENIARMAVMARNMPPAFMAHGIKEPAYSPAHTRNGGFVRSQQIGHVLDGHGLYLDCDLKDLGITQHIPYVYERTPLQKVIDVVGKLGSDDRGAITTYDGIVNARGGGNATDFMCSKSSYTTVALTFSSSFRAAGFPVAGTYSNIPTGAALDRSNVGALSLGLSNPTGGNKVYLLTFGLMAAQQLNMLLLVDILVAAGNISANVNTSQTVSSAALTRYTTGAGVYMTFDVTTALGATPANLTVTYTNQATISGQSTGAQALTASAIAQRLQPVGANAQMILASGDTGVQAVASVQLSAAMGSGVLALNLYKQLVFCPGVVAGLYSEMDTSIRLDSITEIAQTSGAVLGCLATYIFTNTTSTGIATYGVRTGAG